MYYDAAMCVGVDADSCEGVPNDAAVCVGVYDDQDSGDVEVCVGVYDDAGVGM